MDSNNGKAPIGAVLTVSDLTIDNCDYYYFVIIFFMNLICSRLIKATSALTRRLA